MGVLTTYQYSWVLHHIGNGAFQMSPAIPWNARSTADTVSVTEVSCAARICYARCPHCWCFATEHGCARSPLHVDLCSVCSAWHLLRHLAVRHRRCSMCPSAASTSIETTAVLVFRRLLRSAAGPAARSPRLRQGRGPPGAAKSSSRPAARLCSKAVLATNSRPTTRRLFSRWKSHSASAACRLSVS